MVLNKEDFAILQENVHQIENYLRSLMPEIVESFGVGFGNTVVRYDEGSGSRVLETEYRLILGKDALLGRQGFLIYTFAPEEVKVTGCVSVYSRGHGEKFMQSLVRQWPKIKYEINLALDYQQSKLNKIRNFKL